MANDRLPPKNYEPIANDDSLIFDGIGKPGIIARNYLNARSRATFLTDDNPFTSET
jgi:hypothetical protein